MGIDLAKLILFTNSYIGIIIVALFGIKIINSVIDLFQR